MLSARAGSFSEQPLKKIASAQNGAKILFKVTLPYHKRREFIIQIDVSINNRTEQIR
jgi:hypothetical protein